MKGALMKKRMIAGLALAAIAAVGCGGDGEAGGGSGGGGSASVSLVAEGLKFSPTSLSAASGSSIEFTNEDDAKHSFTAEDAGIDEEVDAKASTTVDLSGVEAGSYEFVCKFHPDMKGTLEVTG
ncbi:MAG TPA: cupredoxin domain-containing protein [Actinomycetota bacterium]|jgi:plastocyanin|nr:cupredoxin domain-containing protein [Actinomycetota bacterium]